MRNVHKLPTVFIELAMVFKILPLKALVELSCKYTEELCFRYNVQEINM